MIELITNLIMVEVKAQKVTCSICGETNTNEFAIETVNIHHDNDIQKPLQCDVQLRCYSCYDDTYITIN